MATVVIQSGVEASAGPTFLIKVTDPTTSHSVHYLTLAVWEYDKDHAHTQAQQDGCDDIAAEFDTEAAAQAGSLTVEAGIRSGPPSSAVDANHTDAS